MSSNFITKIFTTMLKRFQKKELAVIGNIIGENLKSELEMGI